ncbi:MAG: membrane protein [Nitrospinaceae bacterium]|nr:MAG: membrane protein [Nitrospinaceae bacterium]
MNFLIELLGSGPSEYNEWDIQWAPENIELILALLCVAVPLALWFFWTSLSRVPSRLKKVFLFSLRMFVFVLLGLLLLKPQLELKKSHSLKNSIAVLLDDSKSMAIKTFPTEETRIDLVRKTVEANQGYFDALKNDFNVDLFFVSDHIKSVSDANPTTGYEPRTPNTDFDRVFTQLKKQYEKKPLKGVFLFTDGADLTEGTGEASSDLMERLAGIDGPVHTFQAGTNESFKDLSIQNLDAPDFGFVHQPIDLSVSLYASSMGNRNIPLVLKEGKNILISKIVEIREDQVSYDVDLEFTPKDLGNRIYSLSVPLFAGESIGSNNTRDFQVKVIRDRTRVLHLNGRPSWDSRFLREVLVNNPKVDLLSFFILRTLGDDVAAPTSELSLIPFPSNLLFSDYLNSFDLVIFQNFRFESFIDKNLLNNIKNYVMQGGAFLMIGGELSFQGGGYERTPIEDILPVNMQRSGKQYLNEEFRPVLERNLLQHPILRLERKAEFNEKTWQSLPPLNGLNLGLVPKPGAYVLAGAEKADGKTLRPVLVATQIGKGRTAVLATDSSWNWDFRRVGEGGSGRYYQRFWNNMIAWITDAPETRLLKLETDKERYQEGEEVLIKFNILKEDYTPSAGEKVKLTIVKGTGERENQTLESDQNGDGGFQFLPELEGFYSVEAEVDRKKKKISDAVSFGVFGESAEFDKPLVNDALLKKIAAVTGGQYVVLNETRDLKDFKFENPEVLVQTKRKTYSLWDNWWSYGLLVGFLMIDWWTRRKSGLS